jgi:hypothetical protein
VTGGGSLQEPPVRIRYTLKIKPAESNSSSRHNLIGPIAMASKHCRIAAVQAAPVSFDLQKSLAKLSELTATSKASGADLVVFPSDSSIHACTTLADFMIGKGFFLHTLGGIVLMSQLDLENLVVSFDFNVAYRN